MGLLTLEQGEIPAKRTMSHFGFIKSPTQKNTKADGNCGVYALLDQIAYIDRLKTFKHLGNNEQESATIFRRNIVDYLKLCLIQNHIVWIDDSNITPHVWMEKMRKEYEYIDEVFLRVSSILLNVQIIIQSVQLYIHQNPNMINKKLIIKPPFTNTVDTIYLLYYPETIFISGHYQSIVPSLYVIVAERNNKPNNGILDKSITELKDVDQDSHNANKKSKFKKCSNTKVICNRKERCKECKWFKQYPTLGVMVRILGRDYFNKDP